MVLGSQHKSVPPGPPPFPCLPHFSTQRLSHSTFPALFFPPSALSASLHVLLEVASSGCEPLTQPPICSGGFQMAISSTHTMLLYGHLPEQNLSSAVGTVCWDGAVTLTQPSLFLWHFQMSSLWAARFFKGFFLLSVTNLGEKIPSIKPYF